MKSGYKRALIVGAGSGLSASLARVLSREGMQVALAARDSAKLGPLAEETSARAYSCDASDARAVERLFTDVECDTGTPDVVIYNASGRLRGPLVTLAPDEVEQAIRVSAFGGFLVAQQAVKRMLPNSHGAMFFTGASASIKGFANSAAFAMGKFALRGLAQSMARELSPKGIHVAHFIIDGAIRNPGRSEAPDKPIRCSIPMRSPKPICRYCASREAPGPGRSNSGLGSRRSDPSYDCGASVLVGLAPFFGFDARRFPAFALRAFFSIFSVMSSIASSSALISFSMPATSTPSLRAPSASLA